MKNKFSSLIRKTKLNGLVILLILISQTNCYSQFSFTVEGPIAITSKSYDITVGDFNNTGRPEAIVTHPQNYNNTTPSSSNIVTYLKYNTFSSVWESNIIENIGGYASQSITSGDYDGDGNRDFVFASYCNCDDYYLYKGDGADGFANAVSSFYGKRATLDMITGELNNDGKPDIVTGGNTMLSKYLNTSTGAGNFSFNRQPFIVPSADNSSYGYSMADFDGDGFNDIVAAVPAEAKVRVFLNDGVGGFDGNVFDDYTIAGSSSYNIRGVATGDFNDDGYPDIVAASYEGNAIGVLINTGDGFGTFYPVILYSVTTPKWVEIGDLNDDGFLDVVVAASNISIFSGKGDGTFASTPYEYSLYQVNRLKVADMNNDGREDIAVITTDAFRVLLQNNAPVANNYGTYNVNTGGVVSGNVFTNYTDTDNDDLDVTVIPTLTYGSFNSFDLETGAFEYAGPVNWAGTFTFNYTVTDGIATVIGTDTITVNDTIVPVIDCPGDIEVNSDPDICGAVVNFGKITFSEFFTQGEISPHVAAWTEFRSQLLSTYSYSKLTMKGTYDPVGVSITDPVKILNIANALCNGTIYETTDGGLNWAVGYCGGVELYAGTTNSTTCYCTSGDYTIRAEYTEYDAWGGINTYSCENAPSQQMTVEFEIGGGELTATDNCSVDVVQTEGLPSGSEFPIGTTNNTFKATDASGNTSYCSFDVTVNDIPPVLVVNPIEIELYASGEYVLTKDDIKAISAGTTDNCDDSADLTITVFPKSFECVHVGEPINVKVTATDKSGKSSSAWTTVTVYDETPPVALCKDLNLVLDENGKAKINPSKVNGGDGAIVLPGWARTYNETATGSYDACGISSLNIDQYNFDCSDIGENTVTLTVVDAHGNTSTCESTVTVSDNMVPVIEPVNDVELVIEPGNCDSELEYPELVVHDNCETTLELTEGLGPDGMFPVGTTTETWLVTDDAGNTASVSFDITIIATNAMPTINEQTDITVAEDTYSVGVTLTGIFEGDDCEEQEVTITATGDNPELITSVTVDYTAGDSTGTVTMMISPEMSGEAEIIVTVEDEEGGTVSDTFMVTVNPVNDEPVLLHAIADETVNASYELKVPISSVLGEMFDDVDDETLTIEVVAEGTDSLPTWAMMMGDTLVFTPTIADTGCVNIVVTATDAGGLSVNDTFEVCVDGYPVSIGDLGMNKFEVQMYPNPTRGQVNMDINSGIYDVQLSVMDITGKVVLQKKFSASENITFDMSGKVSGMYFVKLNIDGKQIVKKLIVDRK